MNQLARRIDCSILTLRATLRANQLHSLLGIAAQERRSGGGPIGVAVEREVWYVVAAQLGDEFRPSLEDCVDGEGEDGAEDDVEDGVDALVDGDGY